MHLARQPRHGGCWAGKVVGCGSLCVFYSIDSPYPLCGLSEMRGSGGGLRLAKGQCAARLVLRAPAQRLEW
jgi:hypothetical protein